MDTIRGVDPYGTGGTCPPNIYKRRDIHGNVPQYFRSDVVYDVGESDSNCCLLYFNALAQWMNVGLWLAVFHCPSPDLQLTGDHSRG